MLPNKGLSSHVKCYLTGLNENNLFRRQEHDNISQEGIYEGHTSSLS